MFFFRKKPAREAPDTDLRAADTENDLADIENDLADIENDLADPAVDKGPEEDEPKVGDVLSPPEEDEEIELEDGRVFSLSFYEDIRAARAEDLKLILEEQRELYSPEEYAYVEEVFAERLGDIH